MDIAGMVRAVFLRRVVVAVAVIAAVVCGAAGWKSVTVEYESVGAVVAIPPGAGNPNPTLNPFTNLSNTAQLAHVLSTVALSEDARKVVEAKGGSPDYVVSTVAGEGSSALLSPQVLFAVRAPDQWTSREAAVALIDFLRTRLKTMQEEAGALPGTLADLRVSVEPRPGVLSGADPVRAAVGYAMGGVLLTMFVFVMIAGLRSAVRGTQGDGPPDGDGDPSGGNGEPKAPPGTGDAPDSAPEAPSGTPTGADGRDRVPL
ncbi:hypothetical protein [Tsukamurella pseudospumae]|uniref:Polysaccharide chain length determinant N-terminal domain-containing protein n=1 Tax=Tsukamurella pseudospumae TaxID=239498 RepID=A0A137ZXW6_9ACTN|nr:hypothetical protein [Tsukamurella pseudospumae]KXO98286.1 hypothetical protein AXK61_19875 [Tsukamurella pseudospumae]KXP03030.1 hypothetical protein AXK60_14215 [Tsukamurella pseudospumae]